MIRKTAYITKRLEHHEANKRHARTKSGHEDGCARQLGRDYKLSDELKVGQSPPKKR
jgi:hypothetical protein